VGATWLVAEMRLAEGFSLPTLMCYLQETHSAQGKALTVDIVGMVAMIRT
jgi:hypothetical protein